MKRKALLRQLADIAAEKGLPFALARHGANHDIYLMGSTPIIVARHNDITETTARATIREADKL